MPGDGKPVAVVVNRDDVDAFGLHPIAVAGHREAGAVTADGKRVVVTSRGRRRIPFAESSHTDLPVRRPLIGPLYRPTTVEAAHLSLRRIAPNPSLTSRGCTQKQDPNACNRSRFHWGCLCCSD